MRRSCFPFFVMLVLSPVMLLALGLSSCHSGSKRSVTPMATAAAAYQSKPGNPFHPNQKGWIGTKIDQLRGKSPAPKTQSVEKTSTEVFRSNQ